MADPSMTLAVDAAMVEMANIHPPLRRSECERLIRAALGAIGPAALADELADLDRLVRIADEMTRNPDAVERFRVAYTEHLTKKAMAG